jgi:hypothetical protein
MVPSGVSVVALAVVRSGGESPASPLLPSGCGSGGTFSSLEVAS